MEEFFMYAKVIGIKTTSEGKIQVSLEAQGKFYVVDDVTGVIQKVYGKKVQARKIARGLRKKITRGKYLVRNGQLQDFDESLTKAIIAW